MGQAPKKLFPERSVLDRWGYEMRRLRMVRGWSLQYVSDVVHINPSHLSRLERAQRVPNGDQARLLDALLGGNGLLVDLWQDVIENPPPGKRVSRRAMASDNTCPGVAERFALAAATAAEVVRAAEATGRQDRDPMVQPYALLDALRVLEDTIPRVRKELVEWAAVAQREGVIMRHDASRLANAVARDAGDLSAGYDKPYPVGHGEGKRRRGDDRGKRSGPVRPEEG